MSGELQGFLFFHFITKRKQMKPDKKASSAKVFHRSFRLINKKPVDNVEKSVDNSKTRICGKHLLQTLIFRRCIFCQGVFEKTQKVFMA